MKRPLVVVLVALLVFGCTRVERPSVDGIAPIQSAPGSTITVPPEPSTSKPYVDRIRLGQSTEEIREVLGEPIQIDQTGKQQQIWVYADGKLVISFIQQKVFQVLQKEGRISNGIAVGDPEEAVTKLGLTVVRAEDGTRRAVLAAHGGELWIVIESGWVSKFILTEPLGW